MRNEITILGSVPEPSQRSKTDMKYCTALNRWFLMPIGVWPTQAGANIIEKVFSDMLIVLTVFLLCFLLIPCGLHTFIDEKNPKLKMKMIGPTSFCLMSVAKYSFLILRKRDIRYCLEHIDIDWRRVKYLDDREIMLANAKIGRFIAWFCATFMYGGGVFYNAILPLSVGKFITPDNVTIRALAYPVYAPLFSAQTTPSYEIVFVTQFLSGVVNHCITTGACSLAAVFVLHTCGQLKIVMLRLENLINSYKDENTDLKNQMAEIVELHLRALGFVIRIEGILTEVCLVEFVGCTMNICFLLYYFMTEFEQSETLGTITYCVLLISFTFNIFIFCYIGEMLTQHGKRVRMTAYMINWYELPAKNARDLILLLAMTTSPTSITAGKMAELSYRSFFGVLKTAVAYLNFLRSAVL